jgi:hypothetical protein
MNMNVFERVNVRLNFRCLFSDWTDSYSYEKREKTSTEQTSKKIVLTFAVNKFTNMEGRTLTGPTGSGYS